MELMNFLILVWLLKRFLYQPVMNSIENRRQHIEQTLQQALEKQQHAEKLCDTYQAKLKTFEQHQAEQQQALDKQIEIEREKRLARLSQELQAEKVRLQTLQAHQQAEHWQTMEQQAARLSTRFAAKLLDKLASPELEELLITHLLADLKQIPEDKKQHFSETLSHVGSTIKIQSAYPLNAHVKNNVEAAIQEICANVPLTFEYANDIQLKSGIVIAIDSLQIQASLADELAFFREILHEN
nr:F0F1 ATP synthase subunit delta [Photobacterium galatheae]